MSGIKIDINDLDKYFEKGELIPAICYEVDAKTITAKIERRSAL